MTYVTTLTQKGQVTIPHQIRKYLGLRPYERVSFEQKGNLIVLKSATDFLSLKGSVKSKGKYSDRDADQKVSKYILKQYEAKERRS